MIEVKTPLTHRDYTHLLDQQDPLHLTVNKIRRCFLYNNQYFQVSNSKVFFVCEAQLGVGVVQLRVGVAQLSMSGCGEASRVCGAASRVCGAA